MNKKILLICSTSQNIFNFRLPLIKKLQNQGFDVLTIGFDTVFQNDLNKLGIDYYSVGGYYKSKSLLKNFTLKYQYHKIIQKIKPDIVFTFMPKPNTFGVLAAKESKIRTIFSMVEGAGDAFGRNGLLWRIIKKIECRLYKKSFKNVEKVFFLNEDDANEFVDLKLVNRNKAIVIKGVGVDLNKFGYTPFNKKSNTFLMVSRLLKTKGIEDFVKCAEKVKKRYPESRFVLLGPEGDFNIKKLEKYIHNETIVYKGLVKDVRPFLVDCISFILPSFYREGLPMSILEAEAIGRCVITTNNIGCRDTVIDGKNGFIVEKHDVESMVEKCIYLIENKPIAEQMGIEGRLLVERCFDEKLINELIVKTICEVQR